MKWIDLINTKLKNKQIKKIISENIDTSTLLKNIYIYSDEIKREIEYAYNNPYIVDNEYRVISFLDNEYPEILKEIPSFPSFLYLCGKKLNLEKSIGIVGTRNYTLLGKRTCNKIIEDLSEYSGINIISGLANGIDTIALKKAIELNLNTIAVIPTDIISCYPLNNEKLKDQIKENGTVISEFRIGTKLTRKNFAIRNRIIAALSRAVYVAQSYESGGSLITAKCASEYNREIYCTPSNIFDDSFRGCNNLIMNNTAKLINSGHDIAYEYGWRKKSEEIFSNS